MENIKKGKTQKKKKKKRENRYSQYRKLLSQSYRNSWGGKYLSLKNDGF